MKGVTYLTEVEKIIAKMTDEEFIKVFGDIEDIYDDFKSEVNYSYSLVKENEE
ncbi:hypothetical protein [Intestinibacter bartlettii]|uniref:Uncharacterized protein n=1 Tax=Intestinibacter bartlettii TaxID=261299 RepID=A0ABS6DWS1_9FIRM|nr:hypothetical protein [Intestinibacter bartlettii]MBU5336295.1 hypothetical protein [Intestinibacter bartlettii]